MVKTFAGKTTKSLVIGPKIPSQDTTTAVTMETPMSSLSVMVDKTTSQTAWHENWAKMTKSTEEEQAHKTTQAATKAAMVSFKVAAKT